MNIEEALKNERENYGTGTRQTGCLVCRDVDRETLRAIHAEYAKGEISAAGVMRVLNAVGYHVGRTTVQNHFADKHHEAS